MLVVSGLGGPSINISPVAVTHTASTPLPIQRPPVVAAARVVDECWFCRWLGVELGLFVHGGFCRLLVVGAIVVQCFRQALRSCAIFCSSSNVFVAGASAHMLPGRFIWYCARTASFTRRSSCFGVSSIRSICPSHWCLRFRTAVTMSYVRVALLASSWDDFLVSSPRQREFAPFSCALVRSSMFHASQP